MGISEQVEEIMNGESEVTIGHITFTRKFRHDWTFTKDSEGKHYKCPLCDYDSRDKNLTTDEHEKLFILHRQYICTCCN